MITHPHHPLCGQHVEIVRIRRGADPDLVIRLPDGTHAAIAMSLTDYGAPPLSELPPGPAHLLELSGLRHVVHLIDHIQADRRLPAHHQSTLPSEDEADYD